MRRKSAVGWLGLVGLEAFYTRLTHPYKLPGLQWSTDAKSRAVLAVFTAVVLGTVSRGARRGLNWLCARPTGVNRDRLTGALRRLTPIYDARRLDAVENDAARAAQAPKPSSALFKTAARRPVRDPRRSRFSPAPPARSPPRKRARRRAPSDGEGTRRGPSAETKTPPHAQARR